MKTIGLFGCIVGLSLAVGACGGSSPGTSGSGGAGNSNTGGATGTGGAGPGTGGAAARTGGAPGGGGSPATSGGAPGQGGASATDPGMTFFVTSRGPGMGGNLNGLTGADAFCKTLATAVSASLGAKTWHAYLSTTTENARDRIGAGPWRNAAGVIIANNLTDLHDQIAATAALNATWPLGSTAIPLDERGNPVPIANPNVHDILTGSTLDGMLMTGMNCADWTSSATTDVAQIGHCNRAGGGTNPVSWNSAHATTGCAERAAGAPAAMTVASGGGRGSFYCFALP